MILFFTTYPVKPVDLLADPALLNKHIELLANRLAQKWQLRER